MKSFHELTENENPVAATGEAFNAVRQYLRQEIIKVLPRLKGLPRSEAYAALLTTFKKQKTTIEINKWTRLLRREIRWHYTEGRKDKILECLMLFITRHETEQIFDDEWTNSLTSRRRRIRKNNAQL